MPFRYYYSNHKFSIALCNLQRLFVSFFLRKWLTLNRGWVDGRTDGWTGRQAGRLLSGLIFDKWKEGNKRNLFPSSTPWYQRDGLGKELLLIWFDFLSNPDLSFSNHAVPSLLISSVAPFPKQEKGDASLRQPFLPTLCNCPSLGLSARRACERLKPIVSG